MTTEDQNKDSAPWEWQVEAILTCWERLDERLCEFCQLLSLAGYLRHSLWKNCVMFSMIRQRKTKEMGDRFPLPVCWLLVGL